MNDIKKRAKEGWQSLVGFVGLPSLVVIAIALLLFGITVFQKYCDRREAVISDKTVEKFDLEAQKSTQAALQFIEAFEKSHQTTLALLETVREMSKNIEILTENDRRIDARVSDLSKEYKNVRNQKNNQESIRSGSFGTPNRSLREREDDLLATDRQLYPD